MPFEKGRAKTGGRPYGRGNKRNGYRLLRRKPVTQQILVTAPEPPTARLESQDEKLAEALRQSRWDNSEAGRMQRELAARGALPRVSTEELTRRARAESARAERRTDTPTVAREQLQQRNAGMIDGGLTDYTSERAIRQLLHENDQKAIAAAPRRKAKPWSVFD